MNQAALKPVEQAPAKSSAKKTEYTEVKMEDGRTVMFAGKRSMNKEILVAEDNSSVSVRFDFRNGMTSTYQIPGHHILYAAGHGYAQKLGDEVAGMKDPNGAPASEEDKLLAIEALHERLNSSTDWNRVSSGEESVSGASVVIRAIAEVSGKSLAEVKAFLQAKLADAEARGQKLTRAALYSSFRVSKSVGPVIERMEKEKASKAPAVNADDLLSEIA
jgi:hypothetical protein